MISDASKIFNLASHSVSMSLPKGKCLEIGHIPCNIKTISFLLTDQSPNQHNSNFHMRACPVDLIE